MHVTSSPQPSSESFNALNEPSDLTQPLRYNSPVPAADVHDSTVVLAAHQVRIHTSQATRLFLHVGSSPVIEHCSGMGFGPLTGGQRALLGLPPAADAAAAANHFDNVQDFNWLKSTPSPNWCATTWSLSQDILCIPAPFLTRCSCLPLLGRMLDLHMTAF